MVPSIEDSRMDISDVPSKGHLHYNQKTSLKSSFQPKKVIEPFYSGGKVSQAQDGTLATTLGEHVLITHSPVLPDTLRIQGVFSFLCRPPPNELGHRVNNNTFHRSFGRISDNMFSLVNNADILPPRRDSTPFFETARHPRLSVRHRRRINPRRYRWRGRIR